MGGRGEGVVLHKNGVNRAEIFVILAKNDDEGSFSGSSNTLTKVCFHVRKKKNSSITLKRLRQIDGEGGRQREMSGGRKKREKEKQRERAIE